MNGISASDLLAVFEPETGTGIRARNALLSGARLDIWPTPLPAPMLRGILRRRVRNLHRRRKPVFGAAECLTNLGETGERALLVAYADDRERAGYLYPLYVDPRSLEVVACMGFGINSEEEPAAG